jgi:hypothetical protein
MEGPEGNQNPVTVGRGTWLGRRLAVAAGDMGHSETSVKSQLVMNGAGVCEWRWLTPIIQATQEAEIGRITV